MSLAASEYSIGCAQNTRRYVENLVKRARQEQAKPELVIADFARSGFSSLFSSAPGPSQLRALAAKYPAKVSRH